MESEDYMSSLETFWLNPPCSRGVLLGITIKMLPCVSLTSRSLVAAASHRRGLSRFMPMTIKAYFPAREAKRCGSSLQGMQVHPACVQV